ncbi:MAG: hypothetical protein M1825_002902 [Sarcosagium campestre]|nr:MAG: hypothetical protein M1825_002902 [Sarcosagium campestre]
MASDPLNANPTIISPSDLPTRRGRASSLGSQATGSLLAGLNPVSSQMLDDPFGPAKSFSSNNSDSEDDEVVETIDEQEIYDLISTISDPEHPLTLGSLAVVSLPDISITPHSPFTTVTVLVTPTITHCSLATVIGLGVRVRLEQSLPPRFRVDVRIKEGSHTTAEQVSKQLNDKERVAAALENDTLRGVLNKMLETCR